MLKLPGFVAALAMLVAGMPVWSGSADDGVTVTPASDLARDAVQARLQRVAILLEFAADDCPYCVQLEESFLKPMLRSGEYAGKVIMRVVDIGRELPMRDFQGRASTTARLAQHFDVDFTPTVLLVDDTGALLARPLVGISSVDFYAAMLDQRIDAALDRLRRPAAGVE